MRATDARSVPDIARGGADRFASMPALRRAAASPGHGFTYGALWTAVRGGAGVLRGRGLAPGDRVLLDAPPGPEWVAAFLAILDARLVCVPLAPGLSADAVRGVAAHAGATASVVAPGGGASTPIVLATDALLRDGTAAGAHDRPTGTDTALLVYTSGSTAHPRAVELTHANLLADLRAILRVRRAEPSDAFLSMLPPSHLFELVCGTLGPLTCGASVVYPGAALPNRLVASLRDDRISHAMAVPALLSALYHEVRDSVATAGEARTPPIGDTPGQLAAWMENAPAAEIATLRETVRRRIGATLRTLIVGGAALDPSWARVLGAFGISLQVGYGLTEASPVVTLGFADACPAGSVGRGLPGVEVRIAEDGEVLVRGANVMRGYWHDPAATAAALVGGWLRTGDRGRLDGDGFLRIEGRIKEAMVSATGETIYPDEAEPCYASPVFAEWSVVPVRGADGNDVPTLVVVAADPSAPDDAIVAEANRLRAAAPSRLRVASIRRIAGPLPRTATRKVQRRVLGDSLGGAK